VIFPDNNAGASMDTFVPVFGSFNGFHSIKFTDTF